MKHELSWPFSNSSYDKDHAFFAEIKTGVMLFSVSDWGRGIEDIDLRARGYVGTRLNGRLLKLGTTSRPLTEECYPNLQSAELRWRGLTRRVSGGKAW